VDPGLEVNMMTTASGQQNGPPVHVMLDVAEAAADMLQLVLLDRAWTGAAERSREFSDRDREALVALGNKLDTQIATVERHAHTLREVFDSYSSWVDERVSRELASVPSLRFVYGLFAMKRGGVPLTTP
jgi:hypothetical protein